MTTWPGLQTISAVFLRLLIALRHHLQTCKGVKVATALLIEGELWGFHTPGHANDQEIKAAATKIQPYYAVPTQYYALPEFPHTR